jgi:hypothetical protein
MASRLRSAEAKRRAIEADRGIAMHRKADAERAIRHFALEWMEETGYEQKPGHYPSFAAFKSWLESKHCSGYLRFPVAHQQSRGRSRRLV